MSIAEDEIPIVDPRRWNIALALPAAVTLACATPAPGMDGGETSTQTTATGDGEAGDGDGDPTTEESTGEDDCGHNGCGACYSDNACPEGTICVVYDCIDVPEIPLCDDAGPPSLVELPIPDEVAAIAALRVAVGDADGDGDDDLLVATAEGVSLVLDDLVVTSALGPWEPQALVGFGLDEDGQLDLAVQTVDALELLAGDGAGGFSPLMPLGGFIGSMAALLRLDIDGDGDDDLVASNRVWVNDAGVLTEIESPTNGRWLAAGDIDQDGDDEVVLNNNSVVLVSWDELAGELVTTNLYPGFVKDFDYESFGIGPLSGSGSGAQIGVVGLGDRSGDQVVSVWRTQGGPEIEVVDAVRIAWDVDRLALGDFDGDGSVSALVYGSTQAGVISLGASEDEICVELDGLAPAEAVAIGDFDGDGDDEVAMISNASLHLFGDM